MYILDLGLKPSIVRKWFRHSLVSTKMPPHAGFKAILAATGIPSKRLRASARILARILPPRILARVLARILARDLARVLGGFRDAALSVSNDNNNNHNNNWSSHDGCGCSRKGFPQSGPSPYSHIVSDGAPMELPRRCGDGELRSFGVTSYPTQQRQLQPPIRPQKKHLMATNVVL